MLADDERLPRHRAILRGIGNLQRSAGRMSMLSVLVRRLAQKRAYPAHSCREHFIFNQLFKRMMSMKVMVLVKATRASEAGKLPTAEAMSAMERFNESLIKAGILLAAEGLKPSSQGKRVLFSGTKRTVTDGPFTETKELVAGFWLWQVRSMEEAIEWVKRCPNPMPTDSEIEIRPLFSPEDLAHLYPEANAREVEQPQRSAPHP